MYLLLTITVLCFLSAFIHFLVKPVSTNILLNFYLQIYSTISNYSLLQITHFLISPSRDELRLQAEINQLRTELADISMRREYTQYVKIERKILALKAKLDELQVGKQSRNLFVSYGVPYGCQLILGLTLFIIALYHRSTPVIVFDDRFDFVPFHGLMRFPSGVQGGLSAPFWVFINSFVSKHVASYLKF